MGGGRERSVIVWDVHWTLLSDRYDAVRSDLEQLAEAEQSPGGKARARLLELEARTRASAPGAQSSWPDTPRENGLTSPAHRRMLRRCCDQPRAGQSSAVVRLVAGMSR